MPRCIKGGGWSVPERSRKREGLERSRQVEEGLRGGVIGRDEKGQRVKRIRLVGTGKALPFNLALVSLEGILREKHHQQQQQQGGGDVGCGG